ncbi:hypothetical protein EBCG_04532 [Escherichia marmotae]|nr:hypothetical protein EBCG_04532 [Escherichia marmotae]
MLLAIPIMRWVNLTRKDMKFIQMNHIRKMRLKMTYPMSNGKIGNRENLAEEEAMSFSEYEEFFEIWRFEECSELMQAVQRGDIMLFNKEQSKILWSMFVSPNVKHLMRMDMKVFSKIEYCDVDFDRKESADDLFYRFNELSDHPQYVFLFFGEKHLCITPYSLLQKYWNYCFLPSDETTIIITPQNKHFLFSYEERFFIVTR